MLIIWGQWKLKKKTVRTTLRKNNYQEGPKNNFKRGGRKKIVQAAEKLEKKIQLI